MVFQRNIVFEWTLFKRKFLYIYKGNCLLEFLSKIGFLKALVQKNVKNKNIWSPDQKNLVRLVRLAMLVRLAR